jgi:OmpA-OmpF porin, OOP family
MRRERRILRTALLVAMVVLPAAAIGADPSPWYAGAGIGRSDAKRPGSWAGQSDVLLRAQGITSLTTVRSDDTGWKLFGGYQFNENLGVEVSYARLGKFSGTSAVSAPAAGTGTGAWDASAFGVAAVGFLPVYENRVTAIGKLGLAFTRLDVNLAAPRGGTMVVLNPSENRVGTLLGAGAQIDLGKRFGIRAEYDYYNSVGDGSTIGQTAVAVWSLSGMFRF